MVKVSGGARTLAGVERHMKYIGREGMELETDMGIRVGGDRFAHDLVEDWDLDIEALKHQSERSIRGRKPVKLVHNLIFSMPPGTSPEKVLKAVRRLALNEWQLKHRYAMTLHNDTAHPHVHVVLRATSEQGVRLNIRKATLRDWRAQFAANLREPGVAANATERAVRGESRAHRSDGYFRSSESGQSTRMQGLLQEIGDGIQGKASDRGEETLRRTRAEVVEGWRTVAATLQASGDHQLAGRIRLFISTMRPPQTEKAWLTRQVLERSTGRNFGIRTDLSRDRTR
jgi:hypothetical protein